MIDITAAELVRFCAMFLLFSLMGSCVLIVLKLRFTYFELGVFGSVLGMALTGVGVGIAHITGWRLSMWSPHVVAVCAVWFSIMRRKWEIPTRGDSVTFLLATIFPTLILVRSVLKYLPQLHVPQGGAWYLDTDIQFLLSIGTESIDRTPEVFPSSATSPLGYTWLFSGTMGIWAQLTGSNIFETMLVYWPFTYSLLLPTLLALTARILTKNTLVALACPIVFVLLSGPVMAPGLSWIVETPIYMNSPHRDFATLFFLTTVALITKASKYQRTHKATFGLPIVVFLLTFAGTASKGSLFVLLGGGFTGALLMSRIKIFARNVSNSAFVTGLLGVLIAQLLVVGGVAGSNSRPRLTWLPQVFSFTPGYGTSEPELAGVLFIVSSVLWSLGVVAGVSLISSEILPKGIKMLLILLQIVSMLGSFFMVVSGSSQMYLVQSMRPLGTVFIVTLVVHLLSQRNFLATRAATLCIACFLSVQVINYKVTVEQNFILAYLSLIALGLILGLIWTKQRYSEAQIVSPKHRLILGLTAVLMMQTAQLPSAGSIANKADKQSASAVSADQIASLIWLNKNTTNDEIGISNKHCSVGMPASGCSGRWYLSSAISERRFLIEGISYVSESSLGSREELLALSDRFINEPNDSDLARLGNLGVTFAYIDRREPYDWTVTNYCSEVRISEQAIACKFA